jgi:Glycosyl hydrolases family 16
MRQALRGLWRSVVLALAAGAGAAVVAQPASTRPVPAAASPDPRTHDLRWIDGAPTQATLVLSDDFEGSSLDRSQWCTRMQHSGGPALQIPDPQCTRPAEYGNLDFLNDEQQRYVDINRKGELLHRVGGGILQLMATQTLPGPQVLFESSMIRSKKEFRAEAHKSYVFLARVRLPAVRGTWPAFWISPGVDARGHTAWPPEIDFMEGALNDSSDPHDTVSMGSRPQNWGFKGMSKTPVPLTYVGKGFNRQTKRLVRGPSLRRIWIEFGAHWTLEGVCYYVDRVKVACEDYRWIDNQRAAAPPGPVLLNLAVGGEWAGADGIDLKGFPTSFDIDYVRVFEVLRR